MVINEKWIAAFAVNEFAVWGTERVMAVVNKIYDHEPDEDEIIESIEDLQQKVEAKGARVSVAVIGWQRMRVGEEKK